MLYMLPLRLVWITPYLISYQDGCYTVYPVVQFILKVHQLLLSEHLGKNINSSTPVLDAYSYGFS